MPLQPCDDRAAFEARVDEAEAFLRSRNVAGAAVGIILGTGLGALAAEINDATSIRYEDIPHFPRATAIGHKGQLTFGQFAGRPVLVMEGRFHRYEGYDRAALSLPIHVLHRFGIEVLIATNASGGLHPNHAVGDLVIIDDHVDFMLSSLGTPTTERKRSPRESGIPVIYDRELANLAIDIARRQQTVAHRGVYVGVTGPNYETRAEYRLFRSVGGDAIGMSTIPEASAAARLGVRVLGLSTITNVCRPDALGTTDGNEVAAAAAAAAPRLCAVVRELVSTLAIRGLVATSRVAGCR
jgi:purine-nucleoside phosphorylase